MAISLEEINPLERLNALSSAKIRASDVTSKYKFRHFRTSKMVKRAF